MPNKYDVLIQVSGGLIDEVTLYEAGTPESEAFQKESLLNYLHSYIEKFPSHGIKEVSLDTLWEMYLATDPYCADNEEFHVYTVDLMKSA